MDNFILVIFTNFILRVHILIIEQMTQIVKFVIDPLGHKSPTTMKAPLYTGHKCVDLHMRIFLTVDA